MSEGNGNSSLAEVASELTTRYEQPRAALVPLLFAIQTRDGRISDEAEQEVADLLKIDTEQVHEAVTFYPLLSEKPFGKTLIQVCHNISCSLLGAEPLIDVLEGELGIKAGEVTPDGEIGLRRSECLGCCCDAPMMLVGEKFLYHLWISSICN